MKRPSPTSLAFVVAIVLTGLGWQQVMIYKYSPPWQIALWFPLIVLIPSFSDFSSVVISVVQFPVFATVFVVLARRCPTGRALAVVVASYAVCVGAAFAFLKLR